MKIRQEYTCPLELVQDMLRGKWKCIILWRLRLGPTPPSNLRRDIAGITEKMLLQQLKELIEYGMVDKTACDTFPLRTSYFLTEQGQEALKALEIFQRLGIRYMLEAGQEDFLREKGLI